jgi:hypothetical protein
MSWISQLFDVLVDVGHGNIFHSARRRSYVWRLPLVIRY